MALVLEERRGYGHKPDPRDNRPPPAHALLGGAIATAASASLKDAMPDVLDQIASSSCVEHALLEAIEGRLAILGRPITPRSPFCLYDLARCLVRQPLPSASGPVLPPLEDTGSMPSAAVAALAEWGVCAYEQRPTVMSTVNDEPRLAELEQAAVFRVAGIYEIAETGSARVARMRQAIAAGFPVCFAIQADDAFEAYAGGVLGAPDAAHVRGGHYLVAIGYTTTPDGETVFEFQNSWGTGWGENGYGRGGSAFVDGMSDIFIVEVEAA